MKQLSICIIIILITGISAFAGWSEPVPIEELNSPYSDYCPDISADGNTLYFVSARIDSIYGGDDIYVSHWLGDRWSEPQNLGYEHVNRHLTRDLSPSISTDGKTLYYAAYGRPGGYGSGDIWKTEWDSINNEWGEPVNLGPTINNTGLQWSVCISKDDSTLYFSKGHDVDEMSIFYSKLDSTGEWGEPVNLGAPVNTHDRDYGPSITANGNELYFASWHPHNDTCGVDRLELFVAYWDGESFSRVENLCPPINTREWDSWPSISADGNTLYFASKHNTENGFYDIFVSYKTTDVDEEETTPDTYTILNAYPNPFNSSTTLKYNLPCKNKDNSINIYNITGRKIDEISLDDNKPSGSILWDASKFSSGIYFARLNGMRTSKMIKLVMMK
ncbi:MAG: T9SS type A sorting domain-containing protein [candidate division Zixibacteria bacterium]|nr:T9SS type A sorting domain-containing protein [candidate division Zixibacteria bacterium]